MCAEFRQASWNIWQLLEEVFRSSLRSASPIRSTEESSSPLPVKIIKKNLIVRGKFNPVHPLFFYEIVPRGEQKQEGEVSPSDLQQSSPPVSTASPIHWNKKEKYQNRFMLRCQRYFLTTWVFCRDRQRRKRDDLPTPTHFSVRALRETEKRQTCQKSNFSIMLTCCPIQWVLK